MRTITFYESESATGKNSYSYYDLLTLAIETPEPKVRKSSLVIPGRDGVLDITESLTGYPVHENRELKFGFRIVGTDCQQKRRDFVKDVHGKYFFLGVEDQEHFYYGRVEITTTLDKGYYIELEVIVDADPYKVDFQTKTRRENVSGTATFTLTNDGDAHVSPDLTLSANMTVTYDGKSYSLGSGVQQAPFTLDTGDSDITFAGTGSVVIQFREGYLA